MGSSIDTTSDTVLSLVTEAIDNHRDSLRPASDVSREVRYVYSEGMRDSHWHSYPKISEYEESISDSSLSARSPSRQSRNGFIQSPLQHHIPNEVLQGT